MPSGDTTEKKGVDSSVVSDSPHEVSPLPSTITMSPEIVGEGDRGDGDRKLLQARQGISKAKTQTASASASASSATVEEMGLEEEDQEGEADDEFSRQEAQHNAEDSPPPWRAAILTTLPLFMGYSGMIVLQSRIKRRLGIENGANDASYVFGVGVSFLYLGNLIFRLMHNVLFTCLRPRQRVMLSYSTMTVAHGLLAVMYYVVESKSVAWVYVSYMLAGVGIGTFESNLISCLTPMGHATKMWAVIGIPLGFNIISIGAFLLFSLFPHNLDVEFLVYATIAVSNFCALLFYIFIVPNIEFEASKDTVKVFFQDMLKFREWFPIIWKHCVALSLDMFCVSLCTSIVLYIFDRETVPLWTASSNGGGGGEEDSSSVVISRNVFQAIYHFAAFFGDFVARKVAYYDKARNPFIFLILSLVGTVLALCKISLAAPFGIFCIMFANGSIYAQTTKYVDNCIMKKYNLVALSIWLFVGDIGSFIGAQFVQGLRATVGDDVH